MSTKMWRLVVTPLNGTTPLRELDVEATNWMGALRAARKQLGEEGGIPAGASCGVAPDGTVTIMDSAARRKFVLNPHEPGSAASSAPAAAVQDAPAAVPAQAAAPVAVAAAEPAPPAQPAAAPSGKRKFQTVAYMPGMAVPELAAAVTQALAAAPHVAAPAPAEPGPQKKQKFQTVAFTPDAAKSFAQAREEIVIGGPKAEPAAAPVVPVAGRPRQNTPGPASPALDSSRPAANLTLELLLTRDEDPSQGNPLSYRERAYLIPPGMRLTDAEAALRFALVDLQQQMQGTARGKFVNLAAFDHRWTDEPERPPLIVIEWRDWRGEAVVDYPAAVRATSLAPADPAELDERIAMVFESLHELAHKRSAVEGLDFIVALIEQAVPVAAVSACLYDINTDELRFVALTGIGAQERQGKAIARNVGLIGQAARLEQTVVVADLRAQPAYVPSSDGRPGLDATNMLLRAMVHDGHLLGVLQLIDRRNGAFTAADVHVINYAADRLSQFLREVRVRPTR